MRDPLCGFVSLMLLVVCSQVVQSHASGANQLSETDQPQFRLWRFEKRARDSMLPDLNAPPEEESQQPKEPALVSEADRRTERRGAVKGSHWTYSNFRIIKEANPDDNQPIDLGKRPLNKLNVVEKHLLAIEAKARIQHLPVEDLATRSQQIRQYYLEHGMFLDAKQIYMFFVNHHLLPEIQGRERRKVSFDSQGKEFTGRKRVELIHQALVRQFLNHPEYECSQLRNKVIRTYEENGITGNLSKKASLFLRKWCNRTSKGKLREPKSRSAMVAEVAELLREYDPNDYWGRRECVREYYKGKGIEKSKKVVREYCYRHSFIPRIRPPVNNNLSGWVQRVRKEAMQQATRAKMLQEAQSNEQEPRQSSNDEESGSSHVLASSNSLETA